MYLFEAVMGGYFISTGILPAEAIRRLLFLTEKEVNSVLFNGWRIPMGMEQIKRFRVASDASVWWW